MDKRRILLCNLSRGRLGMQTSSFLGSLLATQVQIESMQRATVPYEERVPCYLYCDEFQNFITPSFAEMLSEIRKYRVGLTMANQFVQQLVTDNDTTMRDALFGNVGSFFSFQVGPSDAEFVALQLGVDEEDLLNLPKFHTYAKVLVDGETRGPILCRTQCPY